MNDTIEILKAARQFIEKREDWWDGSGGVEQRLCAVQAVSTARIQYQSRGGLAGWFTLDALFAALPPGAKMTDDVGAVSRYNDTHSHKDVLALFDRAIMQTECAEDEWQNTLDDQRREYAASRGIYDWLDK